MTSTDWILQNTGTKSGDLTYINTSIKCTCITQRNLSPLIHDPHLQKVLLDKVSRKAWARIIDRMINSVSIRGKVHSRKI